MEQKNRRFCRQRIAALSGISGVGSASMRQNDSILSPRIEFAFHLTKCKRLPRIEFRHERKKLPKQNAINLERQTSLFGRSINWAHKMTQANSETEGASESRGRSSLAIFAPLRLCAQKN